MRLGLLVALAWQGASLAIGAFGGHPRARVLDAVIDAALVTCQPYGDACDQTPACAAVDKTCQASATDKVLIRADQTCAYNLGVVQKVYGTSCSITADPGLKAYYQCVINAIETAGGYAENCVLAPLGPVPKSGVTAAPVRAATPGPATAVNPAPVPAVNPAPVPAVNPAPVPAVTSSPTPTAFNSKKSPIGIIVGAVFGGLAILALGVGLLVYHKSHNLRNRKLPEVVLSEFPSKDGYPTKQAPVSTTDTLT